MKVTEPPARRSVADVVPHRLGVADPVVAGPAMAESELAKPSPPVVIDHVRAHDVSCYWDHLECRWQCAT
jgi:hypothetical protein